MLGLQEVAIDACPREMLGRLTERAMTSEDSSLHTQWLTCINFSLHFRLPPNLRSAIFLRERAKVGARARRTAWSQVSSNRARNQLTTANTLFFTKTVRCSNLISWGCCSNDFLKMVSTFFLVSHCQNIDRWPRQALSRLLNSSFSKSNNIDKRKSLLK